MDLEEICYSWEDDYILKKTKKNREYKIRNQEAEKMIEDLFKEIDKLEDKKLAFKIKTSIERLEDKANDLSSIMQDIYFKGGFTEAIKFIMKCLIE